MAATGQLFRLDIGDGYSAVVFENDLKDVPWAEIEQGGSELLEQVRAQKPDKLLIDLSRLKYMGSSMVTILIRLWKAMQENNGRMVVLTCEPVVLEILSIAKLTEIWTIAGTRESALQKLGVPVHGQAGRWAVVVGLLGAAAALVALGLTLSPRSGFDPQALMLAQLGSAGVGLLAGAFTLLRGAGLRRALGGIVVLVCLAVGGFGVGKLAGWV